MKRLSAIALIAVILVGCGGGNDIPTIHIEGRITYSGSEWPADAMLYFVTLQSAQGMPSRPVAAMLRRDGTFTVTSYSEGDGLVPGRYGVIIESWKTVPTMENPKGESYVPESYHHPTTSEIQLEVKPDSGTVTIEHDVPKA